MSLPKRFSQSRAESLSLRHRRRFSIMIESSSLHLRQIVLSSVTRRSVLSATRTKNCGVCRQIGNTDNLESHGWSQSHDVFLFLFSSRLSRLSARARLFGVRAIPASAETAATLRTAPGRSKAQIQGAPRHRRKCPYPAAPSSPPGTRTRAPRLPPPLADAMEAQAAACARCARVGAPRCDEEDEGAP